MLQDTRMSGTGVEKKRRKREQKVKQTCWEMPPLFYFMRTAGQRDKGMADMFLYQTRSLYLKIRVGVENWQTVPRKSYASCQRWWVCVKRGCRGKSSGRKSWTINTECGLINIWSKNVEITATEDCHCSQLVPSLKVNSVWVMFYWQAVIVEGLFFCFGLQVMFPY